MRVFQPVGKRLIFTLQSRPLNFGPNLESDGSYEFNFTIAVVTRASILQVDDPHQFSAGQHWNRQECLKLVLRQLIEGLEAMILKSPFCDGNGLTIFATQPVMPEPSFSLRRSMASG